MVVSVVKPDGTKCSAPQHAYIKDAYGMISPQGMENCVLSVSGKE